MIGPAARAVGGDEIAQPLARLDVDRVLVGAVFAVPVFELAPQAVQMDRMLHHRVVDQHEAHPLAALEHDRLGFREFLAVEAPDEALHIAGEVQRDLARRRARIVAGLSRAQIGVGAARAGRRESLRRRGSGAPSASSRHCRPDLPCPRAERAASHGAMPGWRMRRPAP